MKKYLLIYALLATVALWMCGRHIGQMQDENRRLTTNQHLLVTQMEGLQTSLDGRHASIERLQLRCREYEALRRRDAERIRELGVRLRRVEQVAVQGVATEVEVQTPLRDTVIRRDTMRLYDTLRRFSWRDPWIRLEGVIRCDSLFCRVESSDTLQQIVHRVPRRFLFIRWGTKALRQEIRSSNPHTRLVYADYVTFTR